MRKRKLLGSMILSIFFMVNMLTVSVFAEETIAPIAQQVYTDNSLVRITTAEMILICLLAVIILVEIVASIVIIVLILKKPHGLVQKEVSGKEGGKEHE